MMNEVFLVLLSMSLSGAFIGILLLLLKPLVKRRFSSSWQYYIYLIIIFRMLLPFGPENSIIKTVFQSIERSNTVNKVSTLYVPPSLPNVNNYQRPDSLQTASLSYVQDSESDSNTYFDIILPSKSLPPSFIKFSQTAGRWIWLIWFLPAVILLLRKVCGYNLFVHSIKSNSQIINSARITAVYALITEAMGIHNAPRLVKSEQVASPMLIGALHPIIVLPVTELKDKELHHIFRHELIHYKRMDVIYKWLAQICVCLHWYNPIIYRINREIIRNCELSCDESVIKQLDEKGKYDYGNTLLQTITNHINKSDSIVTLPLNEDIKLIKERLETIMNYHRTSKITLLTSAILTIIFILGAAYFGVYARTPIISNAVGHDLTSISPLGYTYISAASYESPYWMKKDGSIYETYQKQLDKKIEWVEKTYIEKKHNFVIIEGITEDEITNTTGIQYMFDNSPTYKKMASSEPYMLTEPWSSSFTGWSTREKEYDRSVFYITAPKTINCKVNYELTSGKLAYCLVSPDGTIKYNSELTDQFNDELLLTLDQGLWSLVTIKQYENNYIEGIKNFIIK